MKAHSASVKWKRGHYYSSLQLTYTFKTHTKMYIKLNYSSLSRFSLLLPNCEGSHSALIYKFEDVNLNMFGGGALCDGCPDVNLNMSGEGPFVMAALLSERYERLLNYVQMLCYLLTYSNVKQ